MLLCRWILVVLFWILPATYAHGVVVPPELAPWEPWVLYQSPTPDSIWVSETERTCVLSRDTKVEVSREHAVIQTEAVILSESFFALTTTANPWPEKVTVNNIPAPVIEKEGVPQLYLAKGTHSIRFELPGDYASRPLPLPLNLGALSLTMEGRNEPILRTSEGISAATETPLHRQPLTIQVLRVLKEGKPLLQDTVLRLSASDNRILTLSQVLLPNTQLIVTDSPLPIEVNQDGTVKIAIKPGKWDIVLRCRFAGTPDTIMVAKNIPPMPETEFWIWQDSPNIRTVEWQGAPACDPKATPFADRVRDVPMWSVTLPTTLQAKVIAGKPMVPDELSLKRSLWLSFDKTVWTARDVITGRAMAPTRLALPGWDLGNVISNNQPDEYRRVTEEGDAPYKTDGIEIRDNVVAYTTVATQPAHSRNLPIVGWNRTFQNVEWQLHVPPGFRVLGVQGADQSWGTWISQWNLWDLFVVCLITAAVIKLYGVRAGIVALAATVLGFQEPAAIQSGWLWLLGLGALLPYTRGRWEKIINSLSVITKLSLFAAVLVFVSVNLRLALYPHIAALEQYGLHVEADTVSAEEDANVSKLALQAAVPSMNIPIAPRTTGSAVPMWAGESVSLAWHTPVTEEQTVQLHLLSTPWMRLWRVLAVVSTLGLFALCLGVRLPKISTPAVLAIVVCMVGGVGNTPVFADFPDQSLQEELKNRLLDPPSCAPHCAEISQAIGRVEAGQFQLECTVHAQAHTEVPIAKMGSYWLPTSVQNSEKAVGTRFDTEGILWAEVVPGVQIIRLVGPILSHAVIALPLAPKKWEMQPTPRWNVSELETDGEGGARVRLEATEEAITAPAFVKTAIQPFVQVIRHIHFQDTWTMHTEVKRIAPLGEPLQIDIPILPGEHILSEKVTAGLDTVPVHFSAEENAISWESRLDPSSELILKALENNSLSEQYYFDFNDQWRAVSTPQAALTNWLPNPGESLTLGVQPTVSKKGPSFTITEAQYTETVGQRRITHTLSLTIASTEAQRISWPVPASWTILGVNTNKVAEGFAVKEANLSLGLRPGVNYVEITAAEDKALEVFHIGGDIRSNHLLYNVQLESKLGEDRWVLWTSGPILGPVILFWGVLAGAWLIALGAARMTGFPARAWELALLAFGLISSWPIAYFWLIIWLAALSLRARFAHTFSDAYLRFIQIVLVLLTGVTIIAIITGISGGLLNTPDMMVSGNGSNAGWLRWYQDRSEGILPAFTVVSVPMWLYRVMMLLWSLWVSSVILRWIPWAWRAFVAVQAWPKKSLVK